jgi:hypothetical protein
MDGIERIKIYILNLDPMMDFPRMISYSLLRLGEKIIFVTMESIEGG